jgi:hypothetical protein
MVTMVFFVTPPLSSQITSRVCLVGSSSADEITPHILPSRARAHSLRYVLASGMGSSSMSVDHTRYTTDIASSEFLRLCLPCGLVPVATEIYFSQRPSRFSNLFLFHLLAPATLLHPS